jgi:hypothetical protein
MSLRGAVRWAARRIADVGPRAFVRDLVNERKGLTMLEVLPVEDFVRLVGRELDTIRGGDDVEENRLDAAAAAEHLLAVVAGIVPWPQPATAD